MSNQTDRLNAALTARYEIDRELGAGGMATVYLAHDLKHDRHVALKVLKPELAAMLGAERFVVEIKTTAALQHPHILPLFDSGTADSFLFYVMPWIQGETLRARLERERQLPLDDALRITREVADALGAAHALGIIHRDIKPENILLQGGHALVADFGIALAVQQAGGARMTQTGLSLGTPQYMSPEQAMGEKNIDLRSDIYALGAVTYEMLTGDPPFTGSSVQAIIAKAMSERPTPLHTLRDTVPPGVESAVLKALAKFPADRFATATAYADALGAGVNAGTMAPSASGARNAAAAQSGARRWVERALAATALVALVALAFGARFLFPRNAESGALIMERQLTFDGNIVGVAIAADGQWVAYIQEDCRLVQRATCGYTLSVREVDGSQSVRVGNMAWIGPDIRWSGDGKNVVFIGRQTADAPTRVYVADRLGGSPRQIAVSPVAMTMLADGTSLLTVTSARVGEWLKRYDVNTLALLDSVPSPLKAGIVGLATSPTDETLAANVSGENGNQQIALLSPQGRLFDTLSVPLRGVVRWTPDGHAVLWFDDGEVGGYHSDLHRAGVSSHRFVRAADAVMLGQVDIYPHGAFDVSRTSRYAIVGSQAHSSVEVASLTAPGLSWRTALYSTGTIGVRATFTPDGRALTFGSQDNIGENLYVLGLADGASHALTHFSGRAPAGGRWAEWADYSPNGARIAFVRGNGYGSDVAIMDSAGGRERVVVPGTIREGTAIARWLDDSHLVFVRHRYVVVIDTTGAVQDSVAMPDGVADAAQSLILDRVGRAAWLVGKVGNNYTALVTVDLRARSARVLPRSGRRTLPAGWSAAHRLLVATSDPLQLQHQLQQFDPATGTFRLVGALAPGCTSPEVDRRGTKVVCTTQHFESDVWLAGPAKR